MARRRRGLVIAALLVGSLSFAALEARSVSAPSLRLFDLTTAHGIEHERPWQPAHVFAPDDQVIYLWYAAEGCAIGTIIRSTWWYLESDPPVRLSDGTVTVDREGHWGQFNFALAPGRRWAPGRYRIELRVDEVFKAEAEFVVSIGPTVLAEQSAASPSPSVRDVARRQSCGTRAHPGSDRPIDDGFSEAAADSGLQPRSP